MEIINVKYRDEEYTVHGDYDKGCPEITTLSGGEPGHEGSPPSFWITQVFLADTGTDVSEALTIQDYQAIEELVLLQFED